MRITRFRLENLRNISGAELETDSPFVVIGGDNAAGKTTLLEAIHLLLAGRSFRTREWSKLIAQDAGTCLVTAQIGTHFLGARRTRGEQPEHRLNGEDVQLARIARQFPIRLFDHSIFDLFEGAPRHRRQLLDWGLFHVKHDFYGLWQRYNHALKQRNALLKKIGLVDSEHLDVWDQELVLTGDFLSAARLEYASSLLANCAKSDLLEDIEIGFSYFPGWAESYTCFADALKGARDRDMRYRRSTVGPHHADLKIRMKSRKADDILSRGQKKLTGFAIKIEQVRMYNSQSDAKCLLLCDDFAAELDTHNQKQILDGIAALGSQVFITMIDPALLLNMFDKPECVKVFHMKQGAFV